MARIVVAQLRRRAGRAVALLLGVLVATTGFTVLTGSTATSRLQVVGVVQANAPAAYDILVRPNGDRTPLEQQRGLVRPNFLSGQFGGITMEQHERVRQIPGVEVAAPIAMIGYATALSSIQLDLTDMVDRSLVRQILRIKPIWNAARGLTEMDNEPAQYIYVTQRPLLWPILEDGPVHRWSDGRSRPDLTCGSTLLPIEIQEDGSELPLCQLDARASAVPLGGNVERLLLRVVRLRPDGMFVISSGGAGDYTTARLTETLSWPLSLLLAAIDPAAEANLVGLDAAVTSGRYLTAADRTVDHRGTDLTTVPVLTTTSPFLDEELTTTTERLTGSAVAGLHTLDWEKAGPILDAASGVSAPGGGDFAVSDSYRLLIAETQGRDNVIAHLYPIVQSGDPSYSVNADGTLTPQPVPVDPTVVGSGFITSWLVADGGFRPLAKAHVAPAASSRLLFAQSVGTFDPMRLRGFGELSALPLETYFPPRAAGADDRSRGLLGGLPLEPDSNPAGYLATPPLMLTTLAALPGLVGSPMPLSAVRVRVRGVRGFDDVSRERVRSVAEAIAAATGLDVDVTMGSSPEPQKVSLPAGKFGRPQLLLSELWSKKGVAAAIIQAVDRKSVVLFGLILLVCVLFLGNAVSAAVRDRRRELAVLACLGWSRPRLAGLVTADVALVGLTAGAGSAALALPLADAVGARLTLQHALSAVPVALGLALLAAAVPALQAARTHPGAAVAHAARSPRRHRVWRRRSVLGLAVANLWRVPGRTALAAVALAVGVAASTVLSVVTWAFHGSVTGSLLGDAVSLRVRGVDTMAVAATVLLGVAAVADVLYLNIRDRAAELAALRATGWSAAALSRLVTYEGVGIGLVGAISGAAAGVAGAAGFADVAPASLGWVSLGAAGGGVLLAGLAALVPALLQRRMPVPAMLAEE